MKKQITTLLIILVGLNSLYAQWNDSGSNLTTTDNVSIKRSSSGQTNTNVSGLFVENAGSNTAYYVFQTATIGGGKSFSITNAGNVGVGTTNPQSKLHVSSASVSEASTGQYDSNFIIESTSNVREKDEGASLGFVVPANTDGSNPWQQGRILVTPDNELNGNASGRMLLQTRYYDGIGAWRWRNNIVLNSAGNVGIGTTSNPSNYKLAVDGTIGAREVNVESTPWPDYVFSDTYKLTPLSEVSTYIRENHHLPGIPTAEEVAENGIKLGEMNAKLLEKVEELTLYLIEQNKQLQKQNEKIETVLKENEEMKESIEKQNQTINQLINK